MSKLLEHGFNPSSIAKIVAMLEKIAKTDKRNIDELNKSIALSDELYQILGRNGINGRNYHAVTKDVFDMEWKNDEWGNGFYPVAVMIQLPDGKWCRADMLYNNGFEWEYAANGSIVRTARLYGDRNILAHNADPLQYLKFRCLPQERLQYSNKEDPCINDDFSGVAPVFLGIELEVEKKVTTPKKIEHMVVADLGMDYVVLKHDGSLQEGFEIVTAPATLGFHLKAWDKFFDKDNGSAKYITSYTSGRCGMHVHVSRRAMTPMHLGKVTAFMNNHENRDFVTTIAGRNSTYSKFTEERRFHVKSKLVSTIVTLMSELGNAKDEAAAKALQAKIGAVRAKLASKGDCSDLLVDTERGGERYSAINLTKNGTVEFRIFRGNVSPVGMFKNLEFVHAVIEFTREATFRTHPLNAIEMEERKRKRKEHTDYALHHTYFIDWLTNDTSGNYNNLKLWLQTHKITDKFSRRKVSKNAPAKCRDRVTEDEIRACA